MDFELTEEQRDVKNAAREFAEGEFDLEYGRKCDAEHIYPIELVKKAAKEGFVGMAFPEKYGGQELGILETCLVAEEFSRVDFTLGMPALSSTFGSEQIMLFGTDEQKEEYLPKIAAGELISCGMYTEPDAGSDAASYKTTAVKDGDDYIINGTKTFITNGAYAEVGALAAVTDQEAPKFSNMGIIWIDDLQKNESIKISDLGRKMGLNSSSTCEIAFDNYRVPQSNLVGEEGMGFLQAMQFFDVTRVPVGAMSLGIAQGAYEKSLAYSKERKAFGVPIAKFEVTMFKLAEMATKVEAARNLVYKAACLIDNETPDPTLSSMAKWYAAKVGVDVADEAIQIHGGNGYMADYDIERFYRNAKIQEIYEGTKEIEKYTIAREIIGRIK
ncbi:MAG: acyl-CoA dehydrogenase [Candidatus Methanolliviera hydrocarbonicum]|uniref:Acyl-CoA dehydrogenase n=1 Tax=Candidatus Methanolliviera hydrocarbonicum TaxID=2491085 RepID=A0A520KVI5_9EURY|nr:MAG: acyl-CoA dehydrogenase [Candidatus Methanolliviera hydrocarbonicum]